MNIGGFQQDGDWCIQEFSNADLGDERLKRRLIQVSRRLAEHPMAPINQAHEDWSSTKAAYRFFQNEKISPEEILRPHQNRTAERSKSQQVLLVVQDTTILNYNGHKKTEGLGGIMKRESSSSRGLIMHTALAFTTQGLPVGLLSQDIWARDPDRSLRQDKKLQKSYPKLPVQEKESNKWFKSLADTLELVPAGTRVVTIADRESDISEFIFEGQRLETDLLIRVCRDRRLQDENKNLWNFMSGVRISSHKLVKVPEREGCAARKAKVAIRFASVTLKPSNFKKKMEPVYIVFVMEPNPPTDVEPLEWMLLSTMRIRNIGDALEKIRWYGLRWGIEVYHRILKSGCRVEACKLQTAGRLKCYLSMMSIIAWRIFWMTHFNRNNPNAPCTAVLTEHEWKSLYSKIHKTKEIPTEIPSIKEVTVWIARLGGFLARKGDGDPGPTTIWRGWTRLSDIADTWLILHERCG